MNRIEEINNELKIIKTLEKAKSFHDGLEANSMETENAKLSFLDALMDCEILDSSITNYKTAIEYKRKLIAERSFIKTSESKSRFEKWLTKDNYDKFIKHLKKKYGNNLTLGFNKHVEEL